MTDYDYEGSYAEPVPAAGGTVRYAVGLTARGVFWVCLWFIVGNAAAQAISDSSWLLAILEVSVFPATFLIYPFAAPDAAMAWPLADGSTLIPFLVGALVAYPISTFVGGLNPVDR